MKLHPEAVKSVKGFISAAEKSTDWGDYWRNVHRASAILGEGGGPENEEKVIDTLISRMNKKPEGY